MKPVLMRGDCLKRMPELPSGSVDLFVCDLPYGTTDCVWDSLIPLDRLWAEWERLLAPGGCVVLFGAMPFTASLFYSRPEWYRDHLVWDKNKCGSPALAKIRPMRVHEDILVFAKPGSKVPYQPLMEAGKPFKRKSKNPDGYVGKHNRHGYGLKPRTEFENTGTRYPKSIRRVSRDFSAQQQLSAAQKPVPLLRWLIETYSRPGATVVDCVMGSGTTGVACVELGDRRFYGIEMSDVEFEKAKKRVSAAVAVRMGNQ